MSGGLRVVSFHEAAAQPPRTVHTMNYQSDVPLVSPVLDRAIQLRRQMLVAGLFKHVAEIHEIEDGYAFRFKRSDLLARRIADYLLFEGQHSPQLSFMLIVEPNGGPLWLEVRGMEGDKERIRAAYAPLHPVGVGFFSG
jgi:hypothetical protein